MPGSGVEQIESADFVIGLVPASPDAQVLDSTITRIIQLELPGSAVIVHPPYTSGGVAVSDPGNRWRVTAIPQVAWDRTAPAQSIGESFDAIFEITTKLGGRGCAIIASDLSSETSDWIALLLRPTVEEHFDLVAPCYDRHPLDGMINRAIVCPLVRALYGKQVQNPMGPDFGISRALLDRMSAGSRTRIHPLASLTVEAVTGGLRICQTHLGVRSYTLPDWTNLGALLAQVLGPLFLDVERYASQWQRARGSQPVTEFGQPSFLAGPESPVDVEQLIDSFQFGVSNLTELWGMILAPSTLLELHRLARNDGAGFVMPDETWARVVYDFALAHRLRTINRDQLLRSLTPIYLGWVSSYALEVANASPDAVEQRLEKLCVAFENTKPHFIGRWRWPDRFNP